MFKISVIFGENNLLRHHNVLGFCLTLAFFMSGFSDAGAVITIDTFNCGDQLVPTLKGDPSVVIAPCAIGGERLMDTDDIDIMGGVELGVSFASNQQLPEGTVITEWNGQGSDSVLGGINLTAGGNELFNISITQISGPADGTLSLFVTDSNSNQSTVSIVWDDLALGPNLIPFSSLTGGADLASVDIIRMENHIRSALNTTMQIDSIRAVSKLTTDCDFNGVNGCDIDDIDLLVAEIVAGTNDPDFDLTEDGLVTLEDVTDENDGWLRLAGEENLGPGLSYLPADITLDGFADGLDFIDWNANKFLKTGLWSLGDVNADGFTDGLDFIIWNKFKFTSSGAAAVPEPGMGILLIAGLLGLALIRPRRPLH